MLQYGLFLVVLAVLFIRPSDLLPELEKAPLYEVAILAALAAAARPILGQLTAPALAARPVTACVLGVLGAGVLSHLAQFQVADAIASGVAFLKIVLLYLLAVANLSTVSRLRTFVYALGVLVGCQAGLGIAGYYGVIDLEAVKAFAQNEWSAGGELLNVLPRLCGAGIFNDPNDLCVLLAVGVVLALYALGDKRLGPLRFAAVGPLGVFLAGIPLTHSRGGMLALLAGLGTLFVSRFGVRKGVIAAGLLMPGLFAAVGERMTKFDVEDSNDTSQYRIRAWHDGMMLIRSSPLFGIGMGKYEDRVGLCAHNSYVETFTDLGFVGGACFTGAFAYAAWALVRLRGRLSPVLHPTLTRFRPYLLAVVVTLAAGLFSLSRNYSQVPYVVLALVTGYLQLAAIQAPGSVPRLTSALVGRGVKLGVVTLIALYLFTVTMVRW